MEKLHIQPSEIDILPYYEFEYTVEIYNDIIKERNEAEKENNDQLEDKYKSNFKVPNSLPKVPNFRMPKF
jgi:hypothetical protein